MNPASIPAKTATSRHRRHRPREGERGERRSKRSSSKRSNKTDSAKTKSNQSSSQYIRECACQRGLSCIGMTQAFRLLGDPRCYYVELPRYRKDPPAYKYVFRNNLRAAYIRHLAVQNPSIPDLPQILAQTQDRRYVALHHFHPRIIQAFYTNPLTKGTAFKHKVPISITEFELTELGLEVYPQDRILSLTGKPTGGYYFCPGYSQEQAHEDLKSLIKKERGLREAVEKEQNDVSAVPVNIEIRSKVAVGAIETSNAQSSKGVETAIGSTERSGDKQSLLEAVVLTSAASLPRCEDGDDDQDAIVKELPIEDEFVHVITDARNSEFDSLWADDDRGKLASSTHRPSIVFEESASDLAIFEGEEHSHDNLASLVDAKVEQSGAELPSIPSVNRTAGRDVNHPWQTPRYRRFKEGPEETVKRVTASPAVFIDPNVRSPLRPNKILEDDGEWTTLPLVDKAATFDRIAAAQKSAAAISAAALHAMKSFDDASSSLAPKESAPILKKSDPPAYSPSIFTKDTSELNLPQTHTPIRQSRSQDSADSTPRIHPSISHDSTDSPVSSGIVLRHKIPGSDPTMRIQVHNGLIAWESKRRTDTSERLVKYSEWWSELKGLVERGMEEVDFAERFVSGFSKAGILFADVTQTVCDDALLNDDEGIAFSSSIIPNHIQKKWNAQESPIESNDPSSDFGKSTLLTSILATQLDLAQNFRDTSSHINEEIMPELQDLRQNISMSVMDYEQLGDGILSELRRSEIELKNIWGKPAICSHERFKRHATFEILTPPPHCPSYASYLRIQMFSMPWLLVI